MIRGRESYERQWQLTIADQAWASAKEKRRIWRIAESIAEIGKGRRKEAFELLETDEQRITYIGCEYKIHGERWARRHTDKVAWLREQGVTLNQALRRHEEWLAKELANPFFTPAKKPKARRK